MRGLLAEFGVVIAKGDAPLRRALGDAELRAGLPVMLLDALDGLASHWQQLQKRLVECNARIDRHARLDGALRAGASDPWGLAHRPLMRWWRASVMAASSATADNCRPGADPAHDRGSAAAGRDQPRWRAYLRTPLIQGARSSLQGANAVTREKANAQQLWIKSLAARMPFGKVLVAIANKHARQLWAMLSSGEDYDPEAWLRHPMVQRPASGKRRQAEAT